MSKRVFEFAKELGLTSKEVLERCKKLGHNLPSQLTVVDDKVQAEVRRDLGLIATVSAAAASQAQPKPSVAGVRPKVTGAGIKPNASPTATYPALHKPAPKPPPQQLPRKAPGTKSEPPKTKTGHGMAAVRAVSRAAREKEEAAAIPVLPKPAEGAEGGPTAEAVHIRVAEGITVSELAQKLEVKPGVLIKELLDLKIMATINQRLDMTVIETLAGAHNAVVEAISVVSEEVLGDKTPDDPKDLKHRPPIVTIMGHVDHGKTKLLDAIRETKVAEGEAGGITQHIGAYQVKLEKGTITFLDTPGHEAFTMMRARGAKATDIVVLVVAADDGVMPQTIEAIDHAKEAQVPIVVALNKIDKPEANPDRVKTQLAERGLNPEEWGGKTIFVEVSAKKRMNIEKLLEMILLEAEILDLKANPKKAAKGVVLEARLDKGRGPVATFLVEAGTLKVGDMVVAGTAFGRVRALHDDHGRVLKAAGPATPAEVLGLSDVPRAGDTFFHVKDPKLAREISNRRQEALKDNRALNLSKHVTLDNLFEQIKEGEIKELKVVVKGDVQGSVEALTQSLEKLTTDKVALRAIHTGVGDVVNSDILLASASNAIILGFNVRLDDMAKTTAEKESVDVRMYRIIYDVVEDVRKAMEGLLEPTYRAVTIGKAEVRQIFNTPKGPVAGCMVQSGKIERKAKVRVHRGDAIIHEGSIGSLKRFKDDVKEVGNGFECGIGVVDFTELQVGDLLEAYTLESVAQKL